MLRGRSDREANGAKLFAAAVGDVARLLGGPFFNTFTPGEPWLVTWDEVDDLAELELALG
jgi:hypothetical protein